jgi:autotransporter strand-loop-strand O-heptosyltransferase
MNNEFNDDIFIIDCWLDTQEKEKTLIDLINQLRNFNIPILLTGHYPVKPEIQKMVDYYLFDKDNPILLEKDYDKYGVNGRRWTSTGDYTIENDVDFHHDYSIWTTMKNAFNFAKYLGKKYIHFLEYDNLPDVYQYKQTFLETIRKHDAVIYEYNEKSSSNPNLNQYCATYIFSIRTDIGLKIVNTIDSIEEYYSEKPGGWQLEVMFFQTLKSFTKNYVVTKYIQNNNELNIHSAWNRDGILRGGAKFQIYLAGDEYQNLYIHFISGFSSDPADKDYIVEINYKNYNKFYTIKKGEYHLELLGKYKIDEEVIVSYQGIEVFRQKLTENYFDFKRKNNLTHKDKKIQYNFIDGAFIEILENKKNKYKVEFINNLNNNVEYSTIIESNYWTKCFKQYFINWKIKITDLGTNQTTEHFYNPSGKRILIGFESKSLGDTIAWIPYVDEFRKFWNCHVICATFHNEFLKEIYPDLEFVEPGSVVYDLYALYRIGYFFNEDRTGHDENKHPSDPKKIPLQQIATDILGFQFQELRPPIKRITNEKKKMVTIGIHSTSQAKYWNNPTGWQEVTDYLISKGYEVVLLSKEHNGYMGNYHPEGIKINPPGSLKDLVKILQESEMFIGVSSGLSWLSWAAGVPTIIISGFTDKHLEPHNNKLVYRVINEKVCHGCWSHELFDPGNWDWCPRLEKTDRIFECSKQISAQDVIKQIDKIIK